MKQIKAGFITIIGRPNVGKSTLLNKLIGQKISIVTAKAQTTRNNIRGILTDADSQLIFVDTPGIHNSKNQIDKFMNSSAFRSMKDVDVIIFMAPANEIIGKNDLLILEELKHKQLPKILIISKADMVSNNALIVKMNEWIAHQDIFDEVLIVSTITDLNIQTLITLIKKYLPSNDFMFYDPETVTDQPNRFAIREIIRENILLKAGQEVPHSVAILIDELKETPTEVEIYASIIVERKSQKGIIIGKQGKKIADIKYKSKKQIQTLYEHKQITLNLFVKVQENWRNSASLIKKMGYDKDKY